MQSNNTATISTQKQLDLAFSEKKAYIIIKPEENLVVNYVGQRNYYPTIEIYDVTPNSHVINIEGKTKVTSYNAHGLVGKDESTLNLKLNSSA
jgi:hypothetical protein